MAFDDKVVVTCALTGVLANQSTTIPTPEEIAERPAAPTRRGPPGPMHLRPERRRLAHLRAGDLRASRRRSASCPIILNFSTGTILEDISQQQAYSPPTGRRSAR
ncbi:MAG: hypothetical protein R3B82_07400 [Sandaracinaceae bacterium]